MTDIEAHHVRLVTQYQPTHLQLTFSSPVCNYGVVLFLIVVFKYYTIQAPEYYTTTIAGPVPNTSLSPWNTTLHPTLPQLTTLQPTQLQLTTPQLPTITPPRQLSTTRLLVLLQPSIYRLK